MLTLAFVTIVASEHGTLYIGWLITKINIRFLILKSIWRIFHFILIFSFVFESTMRWSFKQFIIVSVIIFVVWVHRIAINVRIMVLRVHLWISLSSIVFRWRIDMIVPHQVWVLLNHGISLTH